MSAIDGAYYGRRWYVGLRSRTPGTLRYHNMTVADINMGTGRNKIPLPAAGCTMRARAVLAFAQKREESRRGISQFSYIATSVGGGQSPVRITQR
jgi:hypothetical protein